MRPFDAGMLLNRISGICPVDSISMGTPTDKTTWTVVPSAFATPGQTKALSDFIVSTDPGQPTPDEALADFAITPQLIAALIYAVQGNLPKNLPRFAADALSKAQGALSAVPVELSPVTVG